MKEIVVTQYVAEDGEVFETKEQCIAYEKKSKETPELRKAVRKIKDICAEGNCHFCPFNDGNYGCGFSNCYHTPEHWDIPEG